MHEINAEFMKILKGTIKKSTAASLFANYDFVKIVNEVESKLSPDKDRNDINYFVEFNIVDTNNNELPFYYSLFHKISNINNINNNKNISVTIHKLEEDKTNTLLPPKRMFSTIELLHNKLSELVSKHAEYNVRMKETSNNGPLYKQINKNTQKFINENNHLLFLNDSKSDNTIVYISFFIKCDDNIFITVISGDSKNSITKYNLYKDLKII